MFHRLEIKIIIRVALLFIVTLAITILIVEENKMFAWALIPVILYQLYNLYRFHRKTFDELDKFVEAVQYKDFSRHFEVKRAPAEIRALRQSFNSINEAFKVVTKEKETQYQYLQKILELVNTGILSFEDETGEVLWMNESLKQMLQIPYLKSLKMLAKRDEELFNEIIQLKPGEGKIVIIHTEKGNFKALTSATAFQTGEKRYKLIAFQNINAAVDETESKAWQQLLSVMTHEIMNSVAPISSLAGTLQNRLKQTVAEPQELVLDDIGLGIDTIKKRSESLLKFAETYRSLNKISEPDVSRIYIRDLFENIFSLMEPTLEQKGIEMEIVLKDMNIILEADVALIEQVLINLVVNAMEAVKEKEEKRITLSAELDNRPKVLIKVTDNGKGMDDEILERIFIPFFTTRKNGSGIGLSLCRQIMRIHKGNLQVQSKPDQGSVFTLQF